ncbi:sulfur carrier protein ThiS [Pseudodesulfovibrio sp.]|uniref:sulfur carrier protein ThiS n=1 Tax=Pseudodesulfovibrio sp. TaxID=2035812 RepID=UPI0026091BBF|nr:sulfur carrier protein ThiS [Pseudodesulfovibrio sp.]MDD3311510.1 sulfur carrier protein ThiS [Pseudodesulfovibrio sp.]
MIVVVNGKETELRDGQTLLELLEARDIPADGVVAELNRSIVPGADFGKTVLNDGDHLEVLRFVGGG